MRFLGQVIVGFISPFFWLVVLSVALWLIRKWLPGKERILFTPLDLLLAARWNVTSRLGRFGLSVLNYVLIFSAFLGTALIVTALVDH
jgi:hypothetical protein